MWKKRIMAVLVIIILVGTAFAFPFAIHYYSDESNMNKIQYMESKDIDVFSTKNSDSVSENIELLDKLAAEGSDPGVNEMVFEPSKEKQKTIKTRIKEEVQQWLDEDILGLQEAGIYLNCFTNLEIEDIRLMRLNTISYLEVGMLMDDGSDTYLTVCIDSNNYKIYRLRVEGVIVKKICNNEYSYLTIANGNIDIDEVMVQVEENIRKYYELNYMPVNSNVTNRAIEYDVGNNLEWAIVDYLDGQDIDTPVLDIGFVGLF